MNFDPPDGWRTLQLTERWCSTCDRWVMDIWRSGERVCPTCYEPPSYLELARIHPDDLDDVLVGEGAEQDPGEEGDGG